MKFSKIIRKAKKPLHWQRTINNALQLAEWRARRCDNRSTITPFYNPVQQMNLADSYRYRAWRILVRYRTTIEV
jgi:hypothetical protein